MMDVDMAGNPEVKRDGGFKSFVFLKLTFRPLYRVELQGRRKRLHR